MAPGSVAVACLLLLHGALGNTIAPKRRQLKLLRPQKTVRRGGSDGQAAEPDAAAAAPDAAVDAASDAPDAQTAASATPDFDAAAAAARRGRADAAALAAAAEAAASLPPARPHSSDHLSARELAAVIVADLTPHGMLPLAWAAAAGGGTGWAPAVALLATFGAASTYTLFLAARVSEAAGGSPAPALSTLWRLARLPGARCVDGGVAVLCGGCCAFAADLFHALAARAGFAASRAAVLAALLVAPLSPLCLGDDLSVLKYSLVVAFLCHYNALQYYQELEPAERSPRTYAKSAGAGALATAVVFGCTLFGGVAAFGGAALPNVLNNFGDTGGAALARLGTGVAILSGFPLMFAGLSLLTYKTHAATEAGPQANTD
ncbi:hypothetical protein JL721_6514 [Aureococcus anophagefferens]|nr:hypothetical protein JL721_6514 [Aureococcus anophagefferens]